MPAPHLQPLLRTSNSKIILLILDGLGGLPIEPGGTTELEAAATPNLDRLAVEGALGQTIPIRPGITPGSGPAHLALFGYDPIEYLVGRGALEATGIGLEVRPGDVAVRGNFCTLDAAGNITDRRAGRISTEQAAPLVELLKSISLPGVELQVRQLKEYRFAVVMRGDGLNDQIPDTDPQRTGVPPHPVTASVPAAARTASLYQQWVDAARALLKDQPHANGLTLRGFGSDPQLPSFQISYGLNPACVAVYPMYKGVSQLVGMKVLGFPGESPEDEFAAVAAAWNDYDFFFVHIKKTDSKGEDGDFAGKAAIIESVDKALPTLLRLNPDVLVVTGDHSTPARMKSHSWHPVPLLLWSQDRSLPDQQTRFGERSCALGGLGTFPATDIMPLALAHAGRLDKYGA
ncbi:MAG: 2,3-bisphosphoglycerate-independent phosphoglycerate mutase [Anaerolineae bacterium]|nr:MAG: 2,3-bisphosphoglycerate-independent phosphoglycerate mutase [Anaerolineae bacterium]